MISEARRRGGGISMTRVWKVKPNESMCKSDRGTLRSVGEGRGGEEIGV